MIILRLQGLPWSATAKDIRQFFEGLSIPDGGVHIIGGEEGDVFIAFGSDEDARKAMKRQKLPLNGSRIMILLSSKAEMQEVIAESRAAAQSRKIDPFGTATAASLSTTTQADLHASIPKQLTETSSHYQQFAQKEEPRREPPGYQSSTYQERNVAAQSYDSPGYGSAYLPSRGNQRMGVDQPENRGYRDDYSDRHSASRDEPKRDEFMYGQGRNNSRLDDADRYQRQDRGRPDEVQARPPHVRDYNYQSDQSQYSGVSQYGALNDQKPGDFGERRFRPDDVGRDSHSWPSDTDRPLPQRHDPGRNLMPPSESRSGSRNSPDDDDPMEGISMSYPPPGPSEGSSKGFGPSDKFGYSQSLDEDQRKNEMFPQSGYDMHHTHDSGSKNTGYREQDIYDINKERDASTYGQKQFGEASWMADSPSLRGPPQPVHGREPADFQSYRKDEMRETAGRRDDFYDQRGEMHNQPNQNRGIISDTTFPPESSSKGFGSFPTGNNQPVVMPLDRDRNRSMGYPEYPNDGFKKETADFDNRLGNVPPVRPDLPPSSVPSKMPPLMETNTPRMMMYDTKPPVEKPGVPPMTMYDTKSPVGKPGVPPMTMYDTKAPVGKPGVPPMMMYDQKAPIEKPDVPPMMMYDTKAPIEKPDVPPLMYDQKAPMDKPDVPPMMIYDTKAPIEMPDVHQMMTYDSKAPIETPPTSMGTLESDPSFFAIQLVGLPYTTTEREIEDFLQGIKISDAGIQLHFDKQGKMMGTANVKLDGLQDMQEALRRDKNYIGRRYISVKECQQWEWDKHVRPTEEVPKRGRSRSPVKGSRSPLRVSNTCVEVKNLPPYMKETDIYNLFEYLDIKSKGIYMDYSKDGSTVCAYVEFNSSDHSRKACLKNGSILGRKNISVRIISKEIVEAKRNLREKKRSDRRSPGRRSPDRRRSGSPYNRKGRSPGRRGRSSPSRGSSRSSPRRNGPGRRGESPSRRDSRDRESTRSGRRGQSPPRHASQDRKVGQSDKKERRDGETKDSTTTKTSSRSDEQKDRQSPGTQSKSNDSRQTSSRSLLPDPDQKLPVNQSKRDIGRGIVKSDLPTPRGPEEFGKNLSDPLHRGTDSKRIGNEKVVEMKNQGEVKRDGEHFLGPRERRSRFEPQEPNWQQQQKPDLIERNLGSRQDSLLPAADNRQQSGLLDIRQGLLGDRGNEHHDQFRDDQEERGMGLLDDRGNMENRWGGPMGDRRGEGRRRPMDDRQTPVDTRRTPSGEREMIPPNFQGGHPESRRGIFDEPRRPLIDAGQDRFRNRPDFPMDDRRLPHSNEWQENDPNTGRRGFPDDRERDQMDFGQDLPMDGRKHPHNRQDGPMGHSDAHFQEGQSDRRPPLLDDRQGSPVQSREGNSRGFFDNRGKDEFAGNTRDRINEPRGRGQFEERHGPNDDREHNAMNRRDREEMGDQQHDRHPPRGFGHDQPPRDRDQFSMDRNKRDAKGPQDIDNMRMDTEQRERDRPGPMHMHGGTQDRNDMRPKDFGQPQEGGNFHGDRKQSENQGGHMPHGMEEYCCAHLRNVPYQARWPEFAQFFQGLKIVPGGIHIMVGREGRPSGHCFVEFLDCHQARMAEERRLQPLRDRPLQINACSKKMMIRSLEQGGELPQNFRMGRQPNQPPPHGPGPQFRPPGPGGPEFRPGGPGFQPGGPGFQPRGPFQGPPGPNFGPRGPPPGAPFRPRFEGPQGNGDQPPPHPQDVPPEKPRDESLPKPGNPTKPPKDGSKSEKPSTEPDATKKEPPKKTSDQEKKNEKSTKPELATPAFVYNDSHKGCIVSATNLPLTITIDAILDFFKGFNTVKGAVKLDTNEATGKATGQAKILFASSTEANRAIKERNNRPLNGRIVRLHVV